MGVHSVLGTAARHRYYQHLVEQRHLKVDVEAAPLRREAAPGSFVFAPAGLCSTQAPESTHLAIALEAACSAGRGPA
jgi:hypothetical protein